MTSPIVGEDPLWQRVWPAPAKLNLFLHVIGRRDDGYHLLQTVFRFIDIEPNDRYDGGSDRLRFIPRDDGAIARARALPGVSEESDLTLRAARRLRDIAGGTGLPVPCGVTIDLEKHLPQGGGLGGGSSDAATVLLALNRLWRLGFSNATLREIGLGLGADVPVFVSGRNAFASGIGEELTPLDLPLAWYVVVAPGVVVPTVEIFRAPELKRDTSPIAAIEGEEAEKWDLEKRDPGEKFIGPDGDFRTALFGRNDLQAVAVARYPQIAACLAALTRAVRTAAARVRRENEGEDEREDVKAAADAAMKSKAACAIRMTGSGACIFAELSTETAARAVLRELFTASVELPAGARAWCARGLSAHPLHDEGFVSPVLAL